MLGKSGAKYGVKTSSNAVIRQTIIRAVSRRKEPNWRSWFGGIGLKRIQVACWHYFSR